MIVYAISPMDHWNGWQHPDQVFKLDTSPAYPGDYTHTSREWDHLWAQAKLLAELAGWEGDISFGPVVSVLPTLEGGMPSPVLVAWKQSNNGMTLVASPYPLPYLERECWAALDDAPHAKPRGWMHQDGPARGTA